MSVLVVLALTGFSTGRGRGGGDGGGGGCSSSSQNHDSSSTSGGSHHRDYDDDDDDDYDYGSDTGADSGSSGTSSGGYNSEPLDMAEADLLSCASKKVRYAKVRVTNPNPEYGSFTVRLLFQERDGTGIAMVEQDVAVPGKESVTTKVFIDAADRRAKLVARCHLDPEAHPVTR
ncbi:hypothetical protein [Streptomyces sp. bgisy022]|uniref:hypothetical protein n=1 Tax=Streptomyces sp. bgisy022 TaxID=3413769 RepID=UPI003D72EB6F